MKNLYQKSRLLNIDTFREFEKALNGVWSKETAHPDYQEHWSINNKAIGQCLPTALVINDLFGGRLILDIPNDHVWNELPDKTQQDFTRSQFKDNIVLSPSKYKTKSDFLSGSKTDLKERYELLKGRLKKRVVFQPDKN